MAHSRCEHEQPHNCKSCCSRLKTSNALVRILTDINTTQSKMNGTNLRFNAEGSTSDFFFTTTTRTGTITSVVAVTRDESSSTTQRRTTVIAATHVDSSSTSSDRSSTSSTRRTTSSTTASSTARSSSTDGLSQDSSSSSQESSSSERSSTASSSDDGSTSTDSSTSSETSPVSSDSSSQDNRTSPADFPTPTPTPTLLPPTVTTPSSTSSTLPPGCQSQASGFPVCSSPAAAASQSNVKNVGYIAGPIAGVLVFGLIAYLLFRYRCCGMFRKRNEDDKDDLPGPYLDPSIPPNSTLTNAMAEPYNDARRNVFEAPPPSAASELSTNDPRPTLQPNRFYSQYNSNIHQVPHPEDIIEPLPPHPSTQPAQHRPPPPVWPIRSPTAPPALERYQTSMTARSTSSMYPPSAYPYQNRPNTSDGARTQFQQPRRQISAPIQPRVPPILRPGPPPKDYDPQHEERRSITPPWMSRPGFEYEHNVPRW